MGTSKPPDDNRLRITLRDVLGDGGQELIEDAIAQAETCTSGEIVVRVVQGLPASTVQARDAAIAEFESRGMTATRLRNGILLYIALDEHAIELVADEGISSLVPHSTWETAVEMISLGFRIGEPAAGIAMAVTKVGDLLATAFPCQADDVNELSNRIGWNK